MPGPSTAKTLANGASATREKAGNQTPSLSRPAPAPVPPPTSSTQAYRPQPQSNPPASLPKQASSTHYSAHTPQATYGSRIQPQPSNQHAASHNRYQATTTAAAQSYQNPPTPEVWSLTDAANGSIPPDIREQFQCDEGNRVLFWTTPPIDTSPQDQDGVTFGHSARYLAAKLRKQERLEQKRKQEEAEAPAREEARRKRLMLDREAVEAEAKATASEALAAWEEQMRAAVEIDYQGLYGKDWERHLGEEMARVQKLSTPQINY